MSDEIRPDVRRPDEAPVNPEVRHERTDASARALFLFAAVAAVAAIVIHVGLAFVVWGMKSSEDRAKPRLAPIIAKEREERNKDFLSSLDPEKRRRWTEAESGRREVQPRLQSDPVDDLRTIRSWEDEELSRGRIPIEKAMRLLADPARAKSLGVGVREDNRAKQTVSGAASSGRKVKGRKP
jgi:hypothetical protein